jgi:bifunctional purine biosynthesis protein purH
MNDNYEKLFDAEPLALKYGENPHQKAFIYINNDNAQFENLSDVELSYNNLLDINCAALIAAEFYDVNAAVIVKHNTPCGVALGKTLNEAYLKAFDTDPVSTFGATIAFSKPVDKEIAKHASSVFLDAVIAPDFDSDALEILKKNEALRIIKLITPYKTIRTMQEQEIRITPFGTLVQETDNKELDKDTFKVVSKTKPDAEMIEDMVFAWKIAKHVKTNAVVVAKDFKTLSIVGGQTSRIDAVETALDRACDGAKKAVIACDGFIPAIDSIQAAAQCRIGGIIQTGGTHKDKDVVDAANKYEIAMITTGIRHFKH